MELSERKKRILQAIVEDYIATAEPVGSSHILQNHDLGVSSATVRNEMASLEENGYLEKPHTSAGRIPSYLGYRVYVDELMHEYRLSVNEINQITHALRKKYIEMSKAIESISDIMSLLTNYTAVYTTPAARVMIIKNIKLIPIDGKSFVMIVVTDDSSVRNRTMRTSKPYENEVLDKLSNYLNYRFSGRDAGELTSEALETEKQIIPMESGILDSVFAFLSDIANEAENVDVVTTGTANILNHPEFNSIDRTRRFFNFLNKDNRTKLKELLSGTGSSTSVIIGGENPVLKEQEISMVVSNYSLGGGIQGKLAIIGPTRMNYAKVISTLDYLTSCINDALEDNSEPAKGLKELNERKIDFD